MLGRLLSVIAAGVMLCTAAAQAQGQAQSPAPGKTELQWFSQAGFKLTTPGGKVIMIDPWITGATTLPQEFKDLDKLGKIDLILVTHGHGDHLGDAPELAKKNNVPIWGPAGMNQMLTTLGVLPANLAPRMNKGGTIEPFPGVKITMVHADHSSEMLLKDPTTGRDTTYAAGEPVGFIIQLENGFKIYHLGDTGLFTDMKFIGEHYKPDLALVPIGGHFVMDPKDAAFAVNEWIKPKMAFPMHYASNPMLKGTPAEFKAAMGNSTVQMVDMKPGDKKEF